MEQSSEPSRVKKARVAYHLDSTLEIIPERFSDSDTLGNQRLQLKLHDLSTTLAHHRPPVAAELQQQQQEKLQGELEVLREGLRQKIAKREKKRQSRDKEYVIPSLRSLQDS